MGKMKIKNMKRKITLLLHKIERLLEVLFFIVVSIFIGWGFYVLLKDETNLENGTLPAFTFFLYVGLSYDKIVEVTKIAYNYINTNRSEFNSWLILIHLFFTFFFLSIFLISFSCTFQNGNKDSYNPVVIVNERMSRQQEKTYLISLEKAKSTDKKKWACEIDLNCYKDSIFYKILNGTERITVYGFASDEIFESNYGGSDSLNLLLANMRAEKGMEYLKKNSNLNLSPKIGAKWNNIERMRTVRDSFIKEVGLVIYDKYDLQRSVVLVVE